MKTIVVLATILTIVSLSFALGIRQIDEHYFVAQDKGNVALLKNVLNEYLSLNTSKKDDPQLLWKIARSYIEYGLRVQSSKEKVAAFTKAREFGEKSIKLNNKIAMAHYEVAVAIGRLAQYVGILNSLFNLSALDSNFKKAIELDPSLSRAYLGFGMRYRDTPWYVGGSYSKALKYINKAIEKDPKYLNNYLELGYLYEKMNKKEDAKEAFEKVVQMQSYFPYSFQFSEAKNSAEKEINKLK
jgi:tetratricopeptide (TPR) repeat protein